MSLQLTILVGNIGTGKSTIASQVADKYKAVVVNRDSLQQSFSGGVYGRYDKFKLSIYTRVEQEAIRTSFETGYDVIIDATNVRAADRWYFMNIAKAYEPKLVCYNFGSGDEYSLARRLKEPRGIPEKRWRDVHELKLKSFEVPIHEEGFDRIYFVDNGVFREIPKPISDGEIKSHREMTLTDVVEFGKDES